MTESEYLNELLQAVAARAAATSDFSEQAFAAIVAESLIDAGAVSSFEPSFFIHRGMRVDGYAFIEEEATLDLFAVEWSGNPDVSSLTKTALEACFKRAETFFDKAFDGDLARELDVGSTTWGLAKQLSQVGASIRRVRVNVLSDSRLSASVRDLPGKTRNDRQWVYRVWDLTAIGRLMSTGEPDVIVVDFEEMFGRGLPCLAANTGNAELDSYLTVIPGDWLATIYERFSGRLLEQNVRTFLQVKGSVNKGIRKTILDEPHMFFAYNNGISATAENAEFRRQGDALLLQKVTHLQIVNGGQTTASIFNVMKKDKAQNLELIRVQMKLTVVLPDEVTAIVPRISEYANSQNKVSAADFFSNHPFHVRVESFSRRIWAPAAEGSQQQTHWFYERARGQYVNAAAYLTPSRRKEFDATNPRKQLIQKTDLAKVVMTWRGQPHVVSQGAQKNFGRFAESVAEQWKEDGVVFGEDWFRDAISMTIVFRTMERLVQEASWYTQGYRANIVTYSIALLQNAIAQAKYAVDLRRIWAKQAPSGALNNCLLDIARKVQERIVTSAATYQVLNVTEWCKRERCWDDLKGNVLVRIGADIENELISLNDLANNARGSRRNQRELNEVEAQTMVVSKGAAFWGKLLSWAESGTVMTPSDVSFLRVAAAIPRKIPSGLQSQRLVEIERRSMAEGFRP